MNVKKTIAAALVVGAYMLAMPFQAFAARTVSGSYTLSGDEDWTADGVVTLDGATIDLAGYTLKVHSMTGIGAITSSNVDFHDLTSTNGLSVGSKFIWASTNGVEVTLAGTNGNGLDGSMYPAERAFDNVWGDTKINITAGGDKNYSFLYYATKAAFWDGSNTFELNYRFDSATTVKGYRIYPYSSAANPGYPKTWTFEGSNDGTIWTEVDAHANQTLNTGTWYSYTLENDAEYKYYRLRISQVKDGGTARVDIGEVEIGIAPANKLQIDGSGLVDCDLSDISISDAITIESEVEDGESITLSSDLDLGGMEVTIAGTIDLAGHTLTVNNLTGGGTITDTPVFSDLTTDDASKVVSYGDSCHDNYPASFAFNNLMTKTSMAYVVGGISTFVAIGYDFGTQTSINCYRMFPGVNSNVSAGWPKNWTFEGSDDGSNWVALDARTNETFSVNTWNTYPLEEMASYRYYRVNVTAQQGSGRFNVDEFEFCRISAGRLVVNVPSGATVENTDVTISGNVRLVKDGLGTLVVSKASQTYIGGTEVSSGTLKTGTDSAALLGLDGCAVCVKSGGTFDVNGQKGSIGKYAFTLDGGCLAQTGNAIADSSNYQSILEITLSDDSTFNAEKSAYFGSATSGVNSHIYLGGNTISGDIGDGQYLRLDRMTMENGTVVVTNGGWLLARDGVVATNVDFRLACGVVIASGSTFSVRDYEALGGTQSKSTQSGTMAVYGAFTPTSDSFYGCTLMDGSTLDLSTRSTTLNPCSDFTAGATTLKFEENATVNVVLGSRRTGNSPIMSWTAETKPANIDTVKFVRADADRRYSLVVKENGLYACAGLIITFH